jgi:hypothetical protein
MNLCAQKKYDGLIKMDQLGSERDGGRIFKGFDEAAITFAPTYKCDDLPPPLSCILTPGMQPPPHTVAQKTLFGSLCILV